MKTFLELENMIRTWNMKEIHSKLYIMQMKISTSFITSLCKKLPYQCSKPPIDLSLNIVETIEK